MLLANAVSVLLRVGMMLFLEGICVLVVECYIFVEDGVTIVSVFVVVVMILFLEGSRILDVECFISLWKLCGSERVSARFSKCRPLLEGWHSRYCDCQDELRMLV